ncbi:MAG: hypothetical protein BroJett026_21170 [Betaproteobacteria bacterium]|nr:MAG: hypothetical protein BroJett026_21170 [Betaproteobacteria bacterium]
MRRDLPSPFVPSEPTPAAPSRILVVEDDEDDLLLLRQALDRLDRPVELRCVQTADEMEAALDAGEWDLVISDHRLPRFDAIRAFNLLRRKRRDIPFVIMSGEMPEEAAVTVMRLGANDYIDKSKPARLLPVVERELRQSKLRREKLDAEEMLRRLTYRDTLTGLPNGRMLVDEAGEALEARAQSGEPALVVVLNLDRFRRINESFGHDVGDRLLQQTARRLARCVPGASAARLAQDRFAVFVRAVDAPGAAEATVRAIAASLDAPFDFAGQPIFLSCTAGYCLYPDDGSDAATLLQRAESAMFEAKRAGSGGVARYDRDPAHRLGPLLRLEQGLRTAAPRGELFLQYQPIVDLGTQDVVGCEALVRWEHPELGTLAPDRFIPLADETGLIQDIGAWVVREAVRQARAWRDRGAGLAVSTNVSAVQFRRPAFAEDLAHALADAALDAGAIEIEITESVLMEHAGETVRTLRRLKDMGVRISVDDFGTGYSSLAYLKRFPIDVLKIDRSFVTGLNDDPDSLAIVRTIIALAKMLKLGVVAEGVESPAQAEFLALLGCDRAQGFHFARPMLGEDLLHWRARRLGADDALRPG